MGAFDTIPDGQLVICHDWYSGTTVEGTTRGSRAHEVLKGHGSWVWARSAGAWLLRSSRNQAPKLHKIAEVERALVAAGYQVTREIDATAPDVATQETDRAERMEHRADRLTAKAEKLSAASDAAEAKARQTLDHIPMGQPLLTDHYSYRADLNRRKRAWANQDKAASLAHESRGAAGAAEAAARHMQYRESPVTVANRIERFEADRRRWQRELDGPLGWRSDGTFGICNPTAERANWLANEIDSLAEQIAYWRRVYADLQAAGAASTAGPGSVSVGDRVKISGHWYEVVRVNQKSVRVTDHCRFGPRSVSWHKVTDHQAKDVA